MKKISSPEFISTAFITTFLFTLAFLSMKLRFESYGYTLFICIPICIGFFMRQKPTWRMNLLVALLFGLVFFFALLLVGGLEFWFCIVFSAPLIIVGVMIGTALGYFIRRKLDDRNKSNNIKLSILPLAVVLLATTVEHFFVNKYDHVKVSTSIYLPYPPGKVYDYIKSVDTLNTAQPFFMRLGLPVPQKCILQKEETGAMRTCYFEEGMIEEKVTAIKPGEMLKMDVTKVTVPLPRWLQFDEAIYLFEKKDTGTLLTRITTYRTELKPRFYWRWLEAKAIEAEHEYVLDDLKRRLEKNK